MSRGSTWWAARTRGERVLVLVIGALVLVGVVRTTIDTLVGSSPGGPVSSSFSTGGSGLEGYADLLARDGHRVVRLKEHPTTADLPGGATAVVADPDQLDERTARALVQFVQRGGRLVLTGEAAEPLLSAVAGSAVGHDDGPAADRLDVWVPSADTGTARRLAGDQGGRWRDPGPFVPLAGDDRGPAVVALPVGAGHVVALADTSLLQNRNLARDDNAALGLALAGGRDRPVVFVESLHGFGATGLDALPDSWTAALLALALATVVGLWSFGRRFGPPEPQQRELRPPRSDHVEAVAAALDAAGASPDVPVGVGAPPGDPGTVPVEHRTPGGPS